MIVSERGTVVRLIPCYVKDSNGKKTHDVKGYIVDYISTYYVNGVLNTRLSNFYANFSDMEKSDVDKFLELIQLFKSYIFQFSCSFVGSKPYFKRLDKEHDFEIVEVEL